LAGPLSQRIRLSFFFLNTFLTQNGKRSCPPLLVNFGTESDFFYISVIGLNAWENVFPG
jgi:hypothetical protein